MISDKGKMLCLIAFTLTASGCGGGGGNGDGNLEPEILTGDGSDATTEVTNGIDTSDGTASSVIPVSSAELESFVENPLITAIPSELDNGTATGLSSEYITNPLTN